MKKTLLVLVHFCLAFSLSAQTAEEVIDKYIENMGGSENLAGLTSIQIEGKANSNGMEFPLTIMTKGKTKFKSFVSFQGNEIVQPAATDGKEVWNTNVMTMQNEIMEGDAAESIKREAKDFPDALFTYKENGYKVEKGEDEKVAGKDCFKITLIKPDASIMGQAVSGRTNYLIDKETYQALKRTQSTGMGEIETYLSDYREVDGLFFPFKMETKAGGNTVSDVTIESIKLNKPIDDILFAYPE